MNYAQLNLIFVAVAVVVLLVSLRGRRDKPKVAAAVAVAVVLLVALTAVFDNVMIASGLFDYGGHTLNSMMVGLAPIEDFAYPLAAALLLPGLWMLFTRGRKT